MPVDTDSTPNIQAFGFQVFGVVMFCVVRAYTTPVHTQCRVKRSVFKCPVFQMFGVVMFCVAWTYTLPVHAQYRVKRSVLKCPGVSDVRCCNDLCCQG